jgi:hypothetical protein
LNIIANPVPGCKLEEMVSSFANAHGLTGETEGQTLAERVTVLMGG